MYIKGKVFAHSFVKAWIEGLQMNEIVTRQEEDAGVNGD